MLTIRFGLLRMCWVYCGKFLVVLELCFRKTLFWYVLDFS